MSLPILFEDDHCVVINKPANTLVHRGEHPHHRGKPLLQRLRDQLDLALYPVHRLDRSTSGALLFAKSSEAASAIIADWQTAEKSYLAVVRGFAPAAGSIDEPLALPRDRSNPDWQPGPAKPALTHYQTLATAELAIAIDKYPSSRYSLVACQPQTGRKHQLRRHLRHIGHPILCDTRYGKNRHYHYFRDQFAVDRMLLHASSLTWHNPLTGQHQRVLAPLDQTFTGIIERLGWSEVIARQ
ncbi:pseudouridine synthase [Ferrimonas senticii]|uniref:pseudouridine synthase n=1 Tax=Ferrimonas senticii TaxID=394566 RepID=UPI0004083D74|nr:pseudouridine synthase [Ferrimonas senticii]